LRVFLENFRYVIFTTTNGDALKELSKLYNTIILWVRTNYYETLEVGSVCTPSTT
jgi:hypothetical protein